MFKNHGHSLKHLLAIALAVCLPPTTNAKTPEIKGAFFWNHENKTVFPSHESHGEYFKHAPEILTKQKNYPQITLDKKTKWVSLNQHAWSAVFNNSQPASTN